MSFGEFDRQHEDPLVKEALKDFAREMKKITPPGYGFMVMIAKHGEEGGCYYLSSVQREGAIGMLKEMAELLEKQDENLKKRVNAINLSSNRSERNVS